MSQIDFLRAVISERDRLREEKAELVEALETTLECLNENGFGKAYAQDLARAAITKVRGGNNETV